MKRNDVGQPPTQNQLEYLEYLCKRAGESFRRTKGTVLGRAEVSAWITELEDELGVSIGSEDGMPEDFDH